MKTLNKGLLAVAWILGGMGSAFALDAAVKNGFVMKHGQMMIVQDGTLKRLTNIIELGNGTEVRTDGLVVMADSSRFQLREGERRGFDGILVKAGAQPGSMAKN